MGSLGTHGMVWTAAAARGGAALVPKPRAPCVWYEQHCCPGGAGGGHPSPVCSGETCVTTVTFHLLFWAAGPTVPDRK